MRASKRHLPSPAMVVACLALVIALSGASYAAVKLPRNSVGTAQLKKNAVVSAKVKDGSLKAADLANGAVTPAKLAAPAPFTSAGLANAFGQSCGADSGWLNVEAGINNSASYYRDPYGTVQLRGVALKCGTATNTVFTLPVGLRPGTQERQAGPYSTGPGRVDVNPDGTVVAAGSPGVGVWMSLDGITFRCAPSGSNGCP